MVVEVIAVNMFKFGNYICKLRENKNLTQGELAKILDVSDKSISKWENGQAFPRIETFEKLAVALDTTVEDIFSASKDGVKRICIVNSFCMEMKIDINGKTHLIEYDESKWIEIEDTADSITLKITVEILREEDFDGILSEEPDLKEKIAVKVFKKATNEILDLVLQADCTYKISNITPESVITVELDMFDLGDKTWIFQDFEISYPKVVCDENIKAELVYAKGKNSKEIIKKYKKIGLASDLGMDFIYMIISYPLRGMYFKHLCKPHILKKNIINAEYYKEKTEKRNKGKKLGCFSGCLASVVMGVVAFVVIMLLDIFVFSVLFVDIDKPALVATDYSKITYHDDVYIRIDELPEDAEPVEVLGAKIWKDSRTDGLSNWDQSLQYDKVQLFEDDEGNEYLWLVENYSEEIIGAGENGEDKEYDDFDEHYVYVCENQE